MKFTFRANSDVPSRSYSMPPADDYTYRRPDGDNDSAPRRRPKISFDDEPSFRPSERPTRSALDDEIDGLMKDLDNIPRRRRIITTPDSEDLNADAIIKNFNNKYDAKLKKLGVTSPTDDVTKKIVDYHLPSLDDEKRRQRLKNLEEDFARMSESTDIVKPARRQTRDDKYESDFADNFESSLKIKKRNVKVTSESVRY
ncbi:hypothetical protein QYM36_013956 [Artemia franciscana]|uniref:Uncharacterized protein n=1 Tax=Artemia franciscana TaxID=6661 RepID=A0AA88HIK0_ARTSF|nr:hypothetical protein QYM36_013956 [Artemia franciscana]